MAAAESNLILTLDKMAMEQTIGTDKCSLLS